MKLPLATPPLAAQLTQQACSLALCAALTLSPLV